VFCFNYIKHAFFVQKENDDNNRAPASSRVYNVFRTIYRIIIVRRRPIYRGAKNNRPPRIRKICVSENTTFVMCFYAHAVMYSGSAWVQRSHHSTGVRIVKRVFKNYCVFWDRRREKKNRGAHYYYYYCRARKE